MGHKEKSPKIDGAISPYVEKDIISCIHICFFFLSIKFHYLGMCGTGEFGRFGLQHGRRAGLFSGNCVGLHGHHHDGGWVGGYVNALTRILPSYKPKQCFLRVLKIHTSTLLCQSSPSFNFPPFQFPFLFSSSSFHLSLVLLKGSETPRKECFAA